MQIFQTANDLRQLSCYVFSTSIKEYRTLKDKGLG